MMEQVEEIIVHPLTNEPNHAWESLKSQQKVIKLNVSQPSYPAASNMLRFVCMSDTHGLTSHLSVNVPDGDVFLHAGDFTRFGAEQEVDEFNSWLGLLPHKYKIVIAGNHELSFDSNFNAFKRSNHRTAHTGSADIINVIPPMEHKRSQLMAAVKVEHPASRLINATYLQDSLATIAGVTIYGTPWQPEFLNWAFNLPRGSACLEKWSRIPAGVDVLMSHGPPLGHGDLCITGLRAGCAELLATVQRRVRPKYHVFGHIHEGYGVTTDGKIIFVNASTCNVNYNPCNPPFVFDVPIPDGYFK